MNDNNKEAIEEALANVELEDLKVSEEVIEEELKKNSGMKLIRNKGENKNGKS